MSINAINLIYCTFSKALSKEFQTNRKFSKMSCNGKSNDTGASDELDVFNNIEDIGKLPKKHPVRVFQELSKEFVRIQNLERDPDKEPLSLVEVLYIEIEINKHREVKRNLSLKLNSKFSLSVFEEKVRIMKKMLELYKKLL